MVGVVMDDCILDIIAEDTKPFMEFGGRVINSVMDADESLEEGPVVTCLV